MARPRQFEPDKALAQMLEQFWKQGYQATSLDDLTRATGIKKPSLYLQFGDKREVFLQVLHLYFSQMEDRICLALHASPSPLGGIRQALQVWVDQHHADMDHKGCLAVNAALELAPQDPALAKLVQDMLVGLESQFAHTLQKAKEQGELSADTDPEKLARFLVGSVQGVHVMARLGAPASHLQDHLEGMLLTLR